MPNQSLSGKLPTPEQGSDAALLTVNQCLDTYFKHLSSLFSNELRASSSGSSTSMSLKPNTVAAPFAEPASYTRRLSPYYKESHRYLREYVMHYVEKELAPFAPEWESKGQVPPDVRSAYNNTVDAQDSTLDTNYEVGSQKTC